MAELTVNTNLGNPHKSITWRIRSPFAFATTHTINRWQKVKNSNYESGFRKE
jgi:hypothetical protein